MTRVETNLTDPALKSHERSAYQVDLSLIGTVSPSAKLVLELLLRLNYRRFGTFCTLATPTPIWIAGCYTYHESDSGRFITTSLN